MVNHFAIGADTRIHSYVLVDGIVYLTIYTGGNGSRRITGKCPCGAWAPCPASEFRGDEWAEFGCEIFTGKPVVSRATSSKPAPVYDSYLSAYPSALPGAIMLPTIGISPKGSLMPASFSMVSNPSAAAKATRPSGPPLSRAEPTSANPSP